MGAEPPSRLCLGLRERQGLLLGCSRPPMRAQLTTGLTDLPAAP